VDVVSSCVHHKQIKPGTGETLLCLAQNRFGTDRLTITKIIYYMSLEYYLIPNHITDNPNDYRAVSSNSNTYTIEDVYKQMTREGSTVTKAEALAVFEEITQAISTILEEGHSVVTPLVNISSSVTGVFDEEEDQFDSDRHKVQLNINSGLRLKGLPASIQPTRVEGTEPAPDIKYLHDNVSETRSELLTPEGGARIKGSQLKFDEEDDRQGIFFIDTQDGTEHRVERSPLRNMPKELIFTLPDLPEGEYRLEVRSILNNTSTIRSGILSSPLTVEAST